ncbi:MAG: cytochrome b/b6 domain-containing protein [Ginsengibacter sp.]
MKKVLKKHPLAIRWFHWINFPVLAIMIWSGLLIYWANDVYRVGWGSKTILQFFPDSFYKALHIPFRLAEGMSLHFVFMWFFAINGFIYVLYLIFSGEWRLIFPNKKSLKESWLVVLHDLHIRKALPPQKKYNAAQRLAYTGVIFMGVGSLLTGLAIYKPAQFHILVASLGGYEWARAEHFILTILFTLFFLVHVIQVILAGWNNFRSMVTGLDVLPQVSLNKLKLATPAQTIDVKVIEPSASIPRDIAAPGREEIIEEKKTIKEEIVSPKITDLTNEKSSGETNAVTPTTTPLKSGNPNEQNETNEL